MPCWASPPKCSRATGEPRDARGGVKLEAVEGVGRAAGEADGGGVHVDGVSQDISGQGITARLVQSLGSDDCVWKEDDGNLSRVSRASSSGGKRTMKRCRQL